MIKKKRNLFIKLGLCVSAFIGLVCALTVPSKAYTLYDDYVYSSNGLDLTRYSVCTYTNSPYFSGFGARDIDILPGLDSNYGARDFYCYLTDGTNDTSIYYTTPSTYDPTDLIVYDIEGGTNLNYLFNNYSNYSIRFQRMGVNANDYVEYSISDILNYYSLFIPLDYSYGHFGVTFSVNAINVRIPGVISLDYVGFYFGNDQPTMATFENYGIYGDTTSSLVNIRAYNSGYDSGYNTRTDELQQLEAANRTLLQQLNTASSTNANMLFWTIASTPFESFKTIWDVNVLGLNISGFVLGVLLGLIVLYIIKKVW